MKLRDTFECALRELRRRKWRTRATVAGYVLSVAVLVIVASALRFSRERADDVLRSTGTHFVAYSPVGGPACDDCRAASAQGDEEGFIVYGQPTRLVSLRIVERARQLPAVLDASPYLLYRFKDGSGAPINVGGFDPRNTAAVGTTCCAPSDILAGRFLTAEDRGAALLEEAYALAKGLKPGDRITIAGTEIPVVGVVNPGIRPGKADAYLPFSDAEALINRRMGLSPVSGEANVILVEVKSSQMQEEALRDVKALLPGLVVSGYACYRPAARVMGVQAAVLGTLTVILGLFAVALALSAQLSAVIERRRDFAILKAVGWRDGSIVREILAESVLQALAGWVLGAAIAVAVLRALPATTLLGTELTGMGTEVTGPVGVAGAIVLAALLLALAGGTVAGAVPALLAARELPARVFRRA